MRRNWTSASSCIEWLAVKVFAPSVFAVVTAMAITKATEFRLTLHSASLGLQAEVDPVAQLARAAEHVAGCKNLLDGAQITVAEKYSLLQVVVSLLEVWQ